MFALSESWTGTGTMHSGHAGGQQPGAQDPPLHPPQPCIHPFASQEKLHVDCGCAKESGCRPDVSQVGSMGTSSIPSPEKKKKAKPLRIVPNTLAHRPLHQEPAAHQDINRDWQSHAGLWPMKQALHVATGSKKRWRVPPWSRPSNGLTASNTPCMPPHQRRLHPQASCLRSKRQVRLCPVLAAGAPRVLFV